MVMAVGNGSGGHGLVVVMGNVNGVVVMGWEWWPWDGSGDCGWVVMVMDNMTWMVVAMGWWW